MDRTDKVDTTPTPYRRTGRRSLPSCGFWFRVRVPSRGLFWTIRGREAHTTAEARSLVASAALGADALGMRDSDDAPGT